MRSGGGRFPPMTFLPAITTAHPPHSVVFTLWLSIIPAEAWGGDRFAEVSVAKSREPVSRSHPLSSPENVSTLTIVENRAADSPVAASLQQVESAARKVKKEGIRNSFVS